MDWGPAVGKIERKMTLCEHLIVCVALTCEGVPVQLDEVAENVFGEAFLLRQALQQHHHLHLAHSMHSLCRHTPALPVNICRTIKAQPQGSTRTAFLKSHLVIPFCSQKLCQSVF